MKEQETIDKFVQLRAEGKSYDKISKMINVSKPTLLAWGRKYQNKIDELKMVRYESILEQQKVTQEERITRLAKELNNAWEAFEKKEYDNLTKRELLLIIMRLERGLREETAMLTGTGKKRKAPEADEEDRKRFILRRSIIGGENADTPTEENIKIMEVNKDKSVTQLLNKVYRGTKEEIDEKLKRDEMELDE
ncbi:MAG: hypothetical protein HUU54_01290 [Ignavibacteriaceae bacterium]|nr:hypothetical protein [Ignavibacteriaceae bacterium]